MEQKYADIIKLGTSALSDAMDRLGIPGQALGIKPVDRSFLVCGPAFTVHNMPCDIHGGSVGGAASAGCIHANNSDLKRLMKVVPIGTPVYIRS